MDRRPLFMLSMELYRRTLLPPDGRPEKGDETPSRTAPKVLEFWHHVEMSMSDRSNCDITSIFDLRIFLLLGFDCSSAFRLYCDSTFLVNSGLSRGKWRRHGRSFLLSGITLDWMTIARTMRFLVWVRIRRDHHGRYGQVRDLLTCLRHKTVWGCIWLGWRQRLRYWRRTLCI